MTFKKMEKTKKCPVCGKVLLKCGLKNHIINSAKGEVWEMFKAGVVGKKPDFSKMGHSEFYSENIREAEHKITLSHTKI